MNKIISLVALPSVLMFACVAKGGFSVGGGTAPSGTSPVAEAAQTAQSAPAAPTKDLDPDAFYAITANVRGQELAVTFILPEVERGESRTNYASKSKVELRPLTKAPEQQWQFSDGGIDAKPSYTIWTKVSDHKESLSGILWLVGSDDRFVPTAQYRAKHNRLTVGPNTPETHAFWIVVRKGDGFQIRSLFGHAKEIDQPTDRDYGHKWNEERVLDVLDDGTLVHVPLAEARTVWKLTKLGY